MPGAEARWDFLKSRHGLVLSLVLIGQALLFYKFSGSEDLPFARPLKECPAQFGAWRMVREGIIEKEVQDVLRADDTMTRLYADTAAGRIANLFVAYFKSQRTGQAPHSPKNCLPGSGWVPSTSDRLTIPVSGLEAPIQVNRYVVSRGDEKSVVLYWYQTRNRVIASEYAAKLFLVTDSIRYHRSDTALVRVVVPVANDDEGSATQSAIDFVQNFFLPLRRYLPS